MTAPSSLRSLLLMGTLLVGGALPAQRHQVRFTSEEELPGKWLRNEEIASAAQLPNAIATQLAVLYAQGYLEASIDSCITEGNGSTCPIRLGERYRWARLSTTGIPKEIVSEAGFKEKLTTGRPVSPQQVGKLMEDLLRNRENNGHPFARVWLDSIRHTEDGIRATLRMEQGPLVRIDSVLVKGDARTNFRYLQTYIGIKHGDLYNESMVLGVERRIRELAFVTQRQRPYVQFTPERTKLYLFLDHRKASSINGIIGLQPDPNTGQITFTGDLDLRLRNALRRGEAIALNWRRLQDQTQDLRLGFNLPFAFNTPFGVDANLRLFRRDTTFLEVNARAGLDYILSRGDKASVFVNTKNSNRLGSNLVTQPGFADVNILSYGLGLDRERFDYRFNPRSGHSLKLEGQVGRKRTTTAVLNTPGTEPSTQAPEIRTVQYELSGIGVVHVPIKRRSTVRFAAQGGWMANDDLYTNELYRIGGLRSLRGADEASILCSAYAIGTVEYRFVYEENANFFLFVDQGWWQDASQDIAVEDAPLGFGAGTSFETKAGIFSLTYALGRQFDAPILFRGGKVHFGFVSLF
jgi:outer membrane protein assembly factor BamA